MGITRSWLHFFVMVTCMLVVPSGLAYPLSAQPTYDGPIRKARVFELDPPNISRELGITFSHLTQHVYLASKSDSAIDTLDVSVYNLTEDQLGVYTIASKAEPINIAFNHDAGNLLFLDNSGNMLAIDADESGILHTDSMHMIDTSKWGVRNPQGMVYDLIEKQLLILDRSGTNDEEIRIVQVSDNGDGFATQKEGDINILALDTQLFHDVHGIAIDSTTSHIYLLDQKKERLLEIGRDGKFVTERDLTGIDFVNLTDMVMAPSGDQTDAPGKLSLYIANSGNPKATIGNILEFDLASREMVRAAQVSQQTATLVRFTHTSQYSPPAPDTSGVTYLPYSNRLLISDSEVNEMPIFQGKNLFETSLSGSLIETGITTAFSGEPTGLSYNLNTGNLFVSDDNSRSVYTVTPGNDSQFGTSDDTTTFLDTDLFSSNDPEDVDYAPDLDEIFIADGVNSEVYRVNPGPDGLFEGGDDVISSFDTLGLGVRDPEGIAYNSDSGTLFLVGHPRTLVIEVTVTGALVAQYNISSASFELIKPAGLTYSPSSYNASVNSLYIVDRGIDNDNVPSENDGKLFEFSLNGSPPGPIKPTLISPSGNTPATLPSYTWSEVANADYYQLLIYNVDTGTTEYNMYRYNTDYTCNGTTCTEMIDLPLTVGATYKWYMQAWTNIGGSSGWTSPGKSYIVTGSSPTVSISTPANGSSFTQGSTVNLTGTATDPEDGDLTSSIVWASDLDGSLGNGGTINTANLSVGTHLITALTTDSNSTTATDSITITITGQVPGPVTQLSPLNNISSTSPSFEWRPEPTATGYIIAVYDVTNDVVLFYNNTSPYAASVCTGNNPSTDTCSVQPSIPFVLGDDYTWLVRALNTYGNGPWSNY